MAQGMVQFASTSGMREERIIMLPVPPSKKKNQKTDVTPACLLCHLQYRWIWDGNINSSLCNLLRCLEKVYLAASPLHTQETRSGLMSTSILSDKLWINSFPVSSTQHWQSIAKTHCIKLKSVSPGAASSECSHPALLPESFFSKDTCCLTQHPMQLILHLGAGQGARKHKVSISMDR